MRQARDGKRLFHDLQVRRGAVRPDNRHPRRKQLLLPPDGALDHLHADPRAELASPLAVVVEQRAVLVDKRLPRIVRQADGRLPLRRGIAEVDRGRRGRFPGRREWDEQCD